MAGGGAQTGLGLLALRQEGGERRRLASSPNMLAKLFDRPTGEDKDYPASVWQFLNAAPPGASGSETRRQRLIRKWISLGLLDSQKTASWQAQIEQVTNTVPTSHRVTIELLENRAMMLADLRALVLQMERGLLELLRMARKG